MFENLREDWQTYDRSLSRQGLWVMTVYRFGRWRYTIPSRFMRLPFSFFYRILKLTSQILTGIDLPCEATVGRRFCIEHFGGIIVSGDAVFGDDCVIRNGVTVGLRRTNERGAPVIGNRVDIGAGAVILGRIRIGDDVSIGANAVVLQDVPSNSIAVGVPAAIRARKQDAVTGRAVCLALIALSFLSLQAARAQEPEPGFHVRSKENTISTAEIIRGFEAPQVESYTLGDGDEITVDVFAHPDLSGHHVVGPDGKVTIPVVGVMAIAGLSREDAQKSIKTSLSEYYSDLLVTVRVDKYTSFRVFILGRVSSPGALQFDSQPTLLDVVTRAGGLPIGGVGADKAGLGRCAIIRRDRMVWVDLKSLVSHGNLSLNIRLARNDLVYMPDAGDQLVYVLGEVQHPGAFRLTPDMSFLDAFTQAGGLSEDAAADKVRLISSTTGMEKELKFKNLLAGPKQLNFALEEGDIIYVPKSGIGKVGYVLQKASPISAFAIVGSSVGK